jgi:hypothetical protein
MRGCALFLGGCICCIDLHEQGFKVPLTRIEMYLTTWFVDSLLLNYLLLTSCAWWNELNEFNQWFLFPAHWCVNLLWTAQAECVDTWFLLAMNRRGSGKPVRAPSSDAAISINTNSGAAARLADYTGSQSVPLTGAGFVDNSAEDAEFCGGTMPDVADVASGNHQLNTSTPPSSAHTPNQPSKQKKDSQGSVMAADPKTVTKCVLVAPPGVRPKRPGSSNPGRPKPQIVSGMCQCLFCEKKKLQ